MTSTELKNHARLLLPSTVDKNQIQVAPGKPLSTLSNDMMPLDPILFRGTDLVSNTILMIEDASDSTDAEAPFTHIGLLVNRDLLPNIKQLLPNRWYVWESTMSKSIGAVYQAGPTDVESNQGRLGVQIRDLEDVLSSYAQTGQVAWAKLHDNPWRLKGGGELAIDLYQRRKDLIDKIGLFHKQYGQTAYNANCLDLFAAAFKCLRTERDLFDETLVQGHRVLTTVHLNKTQDAIDPKNPTGLLFCSELVFRIYATVGVLPEDFDYRNCLPIDVFGTNSHAAVAHDPIYLLPDRT